MDKNNKTLSEVRKSAAERMYNAENKQRAKSDASNKRTPSSIPVPDKKLKSESATLAAAVIGGAALMRMHQKLKDKKAKQATEKPAKPVKEARDPHEYDYEGEMAKGQLRTIIANAQRAHDMLDDDTNMAEWVQSKITLASDYVSSVADYIQSELKEEIEGVEEAHIASPLNAANANAEYKRQPSNTLKVDVKHLGGVSNHKAIKQHLVSKGITAGVGSSDNYHTVHLSNINHSHGEVKQKLGIKEEVKKGLYYNVNKRKKAGTSRSKNHPDAPSAQDWKDAAKTRLNKESKSFLDIRKELDEKHLTPAEKTKREEIAKAMHRKNPGMPMAKKMAIATAQAKKVAEDTEVNEAVTVKKANYSWGKMMTVHHGASTSYPLHPEHQQAIAKLGDGEKTSFKDETNSTVHAHREGDTVHLTRPRSSSTKTSIAHNHFNEELDERNLTPVEKIAREELSKMKYKKVHGAPTE